MVLLGWLTVATPGRALDLSMEGAVQAALLGNPSLAAARWEIDKARARLQQAGLLPNPELEFSGMSDFVGGRDGEGALTIGFSQLFPVTSRLALAREVRRVEVAQALRELRNRERLLIAEVQSLYVRIQAARERERAASGVRQSNADFATLARQRLAAGQGSLAEGVLIRIEENKWRTTALAAATEAEVRLLELKTLLGLPAGARLELNQDIGALLRSLRRHPARPAQIHRPDVELALLEMDRVGAEVRLARAEAWEGLRLGLDYTRDHAMDEPEGLGTNDFLGIRVSIPLPLWDRKRGAVAEGAAARSQAEARIRALELEVGNAIATASRKAALYGAQWQAYQTAARDVVAAGEKELSQGFEQARVDLRDLLQVRAQGAALRVESTTIEEHLALALIEWTAAAGSHPAVAAPYLEEPPRRRTKAP